MDGKKVERVRLSIEKGDYTHVAFLNASLETDYDRFCWRLLCDINEPVEPSMDRACVNEELWRGCLEHPLAECLVCR